MDDDLLATIHREMKAEADRVRAGAIDPYYVMHETIRDGQPCVENEAMREQRKQARALKRDDASWEVDR